MVAKKNVKDTNQTQHLLYVGGSESSGAFQKVSTYLPIKRSPDLYESSSDSYNRAVCTSSETLADWLSANP